MRQPRVNDTSRRYRLDSRIATGGMGEVWQAEDTVLGREVAVKVLKAEYADDRSFRARFEAEARHAASLHHPHVASVFDFGEMPAEDGSNIPRPFLVMELVPGEPLSALLSKGEPIPPETAADLVAQAAEGIAAAHALDIVHRDVKPANLLVTPAGQVKITDFGIARAADSLALTQTGTVIGTPHYLSPEQAEGRPATGLSDVYALGIVLYECLAGRRPFSGDTPVSTALAHIREPVPPLPDDVPAHLRSAVARALEKDPADRFASAADLATALRGGPVSSTTRILRHDEVPVARRSRARPSWWPWAAAAVAIAVLLFIAALNLLGQGSTDDGSASGQAAAASSKQGHRVRVRRADYLGDKAGVVKRKLEKLGLNATIETRKNPGTKTRGAVAAIAPFGLVDPDATITVTAWGSSAPPEAQPEPGVPNPPANHGHGHGHGHDKKKPPGHHKLPKHGKAKGEK